MPRNDRACCDCQGTPSCCTSCSSCSTTATFKDVAFEIDPLIYGCSDFREVICDPNCIPDFSQSDAVLVRRKTYGCQQQRWTTTVQEGPGETSCCRYYENANGICGCSAYSSDFFTSWVGGQNCPSPIGSGVTKFTYRQVSGIARVHLQRTTQCWQDINPSAVTSSDQFSTCVTGTDNYLRPSGSDQSCTDSDPPIGCAGLSGSPSCVTLDFDFPCWICPFCPGDWYGYPIQQGKVYAIISGSFDVIKEYGWVKQPENGSLSCTPAFPADSTTEFQFEALMEGTVGSSEVRFRQAWSKLTAIPTHSGILYGLGVEFNDFTI